MENEAQQVTVLYHVENHRDRTVTILGVFSDKEPGSGKLHAAKEKFKAINAICGIVCHDSEFRISSGALDQAHTFDVL